MTSQGRKWSRDELLVAFNLYCQMPFGRMHSRNPEIIQVADAIGRSPSALAMKLVNFASLDPSIISSGRKGLGNASKSDEAIWEEFNGDWEALALESEKCLMRLVPRASVSRPAHDLPIDDNDADDTTYLGETKAMQVQVRIKQSFFRRAVLSSYGGRCCITQMSEPRLLVASHIVPWKSNVKNRLNPRNGLCLSVLHDKAFDRGLITISDEFRVQVSPALSDFKNESFIRDTLIAIDGQSIALPEKFRPDPAFLKLHREAWQR